MILLLRSFVSESPRWLVTHCRSDDAEAIVKQIENRVSADTGRSLSMPSERLTVHPRKSFGLKLIFSAMAEKYRQRSFLVLTLMVAQSFLYNSVFFTFGLILAHYYKVPNERVGFYILPLAIGNFCGPLLLGTLFDTVGRRKMISAAFGLSGVLLIATAILFGLDYLTAFTQTIAWFAIFFIVSPAASSAYLTASEIFPLETRALAIACFYAMGTALGGSIAPSVFGRLIETGSSWNVSFGYLFAALLLLIAAAVELNLGVDAEGKSLESIADPLSQ